VEDQESDQQVDHYLVQLRAATEGGSFSELKQALLSVVQGMNSVIDERKKNANNSGSSVLVRNCVLWSRN
jgi:hypothetical protein